jgi:hypothetical protein
MKEEPSSNERGNLPLMEEETSLLWKKESAFQKMEPVCNGIRNQLTVKMRTRLSK